MNAVDTPHLSDTVKYFKTTSSLLLAFQWHGALLELHPSPSNEFDHVSRCSRLARHFIQIPQIHLRNAESRWILLLLSACAQR